MSADRTPLLPPCDHDDCPRTHCRRKSMTLGAADSMCNAHRHVALGCERMTMGDLNGAANHFEIAGGILRAVAKECGL